MNKLSGGQILDSGTMMAVFMMAMLIFFFLSFYMNNKFSILVVLVSVAMTAPLIAMTKPISKTQSDLDWLYLPYVSH